MTVRSLAQFALAMREHLHSEINLVFATRVDPYVSFTCEVCRKCIRIPSDTFAQDSDVIDLGLNHPEYMRQFPVDLRDGCYNDWLNQKAKEQAIIKAWHESLMNKDIETQAQAEEGLDQLKIQEALAAGIINNSPTSLRRPAPPENTKPKANFLESKQYASLGTPVEATYIPSSGIYYIQGAGSRNFEAACFVVKVRGEFVVLAESLFCALFQTDHLENLSTSINKPNSPEYLARLLNPRPEYDGRNRMMVGPNLTKGESLDSPLWDPSDDD